MRGKIIQIKSDGYERCIGVKCYELDMKILWLYFMDNEYLEPGEKLKIISKDGEIDFDVSIVFVNKYEILDDFARLEMRQPIDKSSHVKVKALVIRIIDEWSVVCNIGVLKNVVVEFETKIFGVNVGQKLYFDGELQIIIQK